MAAASRSALSAADAARLAEAFALLQGGRVAEAGAIALEVAGRSPEAADALHMLALSRGAAGDFAGAVAAFESAVAGAPEDFRLLGNYANLLARNARGPEAIALYRRALAREPRYGDGWLNLGLALLGAGDNDAACQSLERAVELLPSSPTAWQAIGAALRARGDLAGAESALRRAVSLVPAAGAAWTSLGIVRRLQGDPVDALACYERARRAGYSGPEVTDAEAGAWLDTGDPARALALARELVQSHPGYVAGHLLLAHVLWEHGAALAPGQDARAHLQAAVASQPQNRELRRAFVRFLIEAGSHEEALQNVRAMRSTADEPDLAVAEAQTLDSLGDAQAAGRLYAAALALSRGRPGFLTLYASHLLKSGDADGAAARASEALELRPDDQLALALLSLAWRLLGDRREDWLCGFDRFVEEVAVETPADFADEAAWLAALAAALTGMHTAERAPVNQSLRGGTQTAGVLFGRRDPLIAAARDAFDRAVRGYVGRLPDDQAHPFLRRKAAGIRFAGSWSVRLRSSGRHANHIHQQGWISSAYYVSLPPSVARPADGATAGFIQFGEPPAELGLALGARRIIRPRAGALVLFPSYLWHGTLPFPDEAPRLTMAFDAVPAP